MLAALVVIVTGLEVASWYFGLGIVPGTDVGWIDVLGPGAWLPLEIPRVGLAMNISTLLAGYVAPLITVCVGWALTARQADYRRVLWILAGALAVVLVLTLSRGGLLSTAVGLGTFAAMRFAQQLLVTRLISPRVVMAAVVAGGIVFVVLLLITQTRAGSDLVRLDLYRSAGEMFSDHPVTGVGTGIYGRAYRDYRTVSNLTRDKLATAHNTYLNTAAETGLLGIAVCAWLAVALVWTWWRTWQAQVTPQRKMRQEAMIAALLGVGVHSMVDVFTTTPVMTVIVLLFAYSIVGHRTVLDERPTGSRWAAGVGLVITLAYGLFFFQVDRAQLNYQRSLGGGEGAVESVRAAERIDPHLNLYSLHAAYLLGEQAVDEPTDVSLEQAIAAYEQALKLEPTWDVGWINLAALYEVQGNPQRALEIMQSVETINVRLVEQLHIARLAERVGGKQDYEQILRDYIGGMHFNLDTNHRLPLSTFWLQTPLRVKTLTRYTSIDRNIQYLGLDRTYRILLVQDPVRAAILVPEQPTSAETYWIAGEHALNVLGDSELAAEYFTEAINRDRCNGDYYVSRAWATYETDSEAAWRDLNFAQLLGTQFEYPNAVRAEMAETPEMANFYRARALPSRIILQEFAAVLYGGRPAVFDVLPPMLPPGPGHEAMQPWYTVAEQHRLNGRLKDAAEIYRAILLYAPDENEARERLAELSEEN